MEIRLDGTYAVTGAGSGIGAAVVERFAACGAQVLAVDLNGSAAERVAAKFGGRHFEADVADADAIDQIFGSVGPVQGLVHCAGVAEISPIVATSNKQWRRVTSIQLDGTFYCLRAAARNMLTNKVQSGTIVTTASINSFFTHRGLAAYAASKAGISMLTKAAALEFAQAGIRVNALAPGIVDTGMTKAIVDDSDQVQMWNDVIPLGRMGQPEDIADVALFLCSELSRWITGATLGVDGGTSLRIEPKMTADGDWTPDAMRAMF